MAIKRVPRIEIDMLSVNTNKRDAFDQLNKSKSSKAKKGKKSRKGSARKMDTASNKLNTEET